MYNKNIEKAVARMHERLDGTSLSFASVETVLRDCLDDAYVVMYEEQPDRIHWLGNPIALLILFDALKAAQLVQYKDRHQPLEDHFYPINANSLKTLANGIDKKSTLYKKINELVDIVKRLSDDKL
jgi:hypothetical protein